MTSKADELGELREAIDEIDESVADLVIERVESAEAVAQVKADAGAELVDESRETVVKEHYEQRFKRAGLDGEDGHELATFLIDIALSQERRVADGA